MARAALVGRTLGGRDVAALEVVMFDTHRENKISKTMKKAATSQERRTPNTLRVVNGAPQAGNAQVES